MIIMKPDGLEFYHRFAYSTNSCQKRVTSIKSEYINTTNQAQAHGLNMTNQREISQNVCKTGDSTLPTVSSNIQMVRGLSLQACK